MNNKTAYEQLPNFLKMLIDHEIEVATEEELENAKRRIDERKSKIIAGVILHVQRHISFQTMGDVLQISVKLEK